MKSESVSSLRTLSVAFKLSLLGWLGSISGCKAPYAVDQDSYMRKNFDALQGDEVLEPV